MFLVVFRVIISSGRARGDREMKYEEQGMVKVQRRETKKTTKGSFV
jgi:hypothetical protein